jgi:hypothetical protein
MVTRAQFTKVALSLPETLQASHFGKPDFRVKGKIFGGLDHTEPRASLKLAKELQAVLVGSRPQAFVPAAGAWGDAGWTMVELGHVALPELRELVAHAWQLIAPARLVAQHGGAEPASGELGIEPSPAPGGARRTARVRSTKAAAGSKPAPLAKKPARKKATKKAAKKVSTSRASRTSVRARSAR